MCLSPGYKKVQILNSRTTRAETVSDILFSLVDREAPAELLRSPKAMMPSINFYFLSFSFLMFYFPQAIAGLNLCFLVSHDGGESLRMFNVTWSRAILCV
jgi:hypothetical protein